MRCFVIAAFLLGAAGAGNAAELLFNGNFEAGNTGFSSDYSYHAPGADALGSIGSYTVGTNPHLYNPLFGSFGDAETGKGNFLLANGAASAGQVIWRSPVISVTKGAEYLFKGYFTTATTGVTAKIDVMYSYNGEEANILGQFDSDSSAAGAWQEIEAHFINTGTLLTISILNRAAASAGQGVGIDDLRIFDNGVIPPPAPGVPEPETWALQVAGFCLVGTAVRRRRNRVALVNGS